MGKRRNRRSKRSNTRPNEYHLVFPRTRFVQKTVCTHSTRIPEAGQISDCAIEVIPLNRSNVGNLTIGDRTTHLRVIAVEIFMEPCTATSTLLCGIGNNRGRTTNKLYTVEETSQVLSSMSIVRRSPVGGINHCRFRIPNPLWIDYSEKASDEVASVMLGMTDVSQVDGRVNATICQIRLTVEYMSN